MTLRALLAFLLISVAALPAVPQALPDLGDASSATLNEQQERTIGNRIMREVRIDPAFVDDPEIADYISSIGARLLSVADPPRREIDYFVVQDDSINAFALVGGHIGVHTGLILLTQNESELAGVLGHETAHILQKHQARVLHGQSKSQWSSLAALALALIASRSGGSQAGQVTEAAIASAGALSMQNMIDYTREHEREADRVGLTLMDRAGFDSRGMATFFERLLRANRLNELKGAPSYLRTHPLTTERIADIQDRLEKIPSRMVPDTFEYRIARSKLRAANGSPNEAVTYFRTMLEDKTILRPREDVYGLALALRRARDFDGAWKTLEPLRAGKVISPGAPAAFSTVPPVSTHPAFELLAAQLKSDMGANDEAFAATPASSSIWFRSSKPGPKNVVSRSNSGRALMVACSSGEKDFCWTFSTKNNTVSEPGSLPSSCRIIGCKAATTSTTLASRTVTRVSTAASAPVAFVGGLAVLATTIPSSPPTPHAATPTVLCVT